MNAITRSILCVALLSFWSVSPTANAFPLWDAEGGDNNFNTAANWQESTFPAIEFVPGPADLAVHDNLGNTATLPAIEINSDAGATSADAVSGSMIQGVDGLRLSHGGSVNHTAGTLNITNAFAISFPPPVFATDDGIWVGEFGSRTFAGPSLSPSVYTFSGGTINIDDPGVNSLQIGRRWDDQTFTDYSDGRIEFSGGTLNSIGDTTIGLDGFGVWNQTSGVYNGGNTYVGRFASPEAAANLSGDTVWNLTGSLLVSDQQTAPEFRLGRPDGAGVAHLNITGSSVDIDVSNNLFLRGNASLNFIADADGVSPIVVSGTTVELTDLNVPGNRPDLVVDLTGATNLGAMDTVTLIDAAGLAFGQFAGIEEGDTVPNTGGRVLTYRGGGDGFDIQLVHPDNYVMPPPLPTPPDAIIGRWSMDDVQGDDPADPDNPSFFDNPVVFDSAIAVNEGVLIGDTTNNGGVPASVDHLWFFSADNGQSYTEATGPGNVPPLSMFTAGNSGGPASYDASSVEEGFSEGALFFPQDIYGNEFSFEGSFSVEAFFKTSDNANAQQIIVQGEGFNRYGLSMNDGEDGSLRFSVNDGQTEEFIEIGGLSNDFADNEWHYVVAMFDEGAGDNGTGLLTIAVVDENGSTTVETASLSPSFLGLPPAFNDGNFLVGAVDFNGIGVDPDTGMIGPIDPKRFDGLIDEVQITRGQISPADRLGVLNITAPSLVGDYNNNGVVDAADYTVWRDNLGAATLTNRDPNLIGAVGQLDYDAWASNFGDSLPSVAVPEPASLLVAFTAMFAFGASGTRKR